MNWRFMHFCQIAANDRVQLLRPIKSDLDHEVKRIYCKELHLFIRFFSLDPPISSEEGFLPLSDVIKRIPAVPFDKGRRQLRDYLF
jgi:hypothetical protein